MFVVIEESYGALYASGPYETRADAEKKVLKELRSIVSDWNDDFYSVMDDEKLLMEWRVNTYDLFDDTDSYIDIVSLSPPDKN